MISGVNSTASTAQQTATSAAGATITNGVDKNTFLKLLVAQMENQNPLNPADGMEYVTQLAQFTQLEQTMQISSDVTAIRKQWDASATNAATQTQSTGATSSQG